MPSSSNIVNISGMFGDGKTYFADSPVIIEINGLDWPENSPFKVVRVEVLYNDAQEDSYSSSSGSTDNGEGRVIGAFSADTGGAESIVFDISSALKSIWSGYGFSNELTAALTAATKGGIAGSTASYERVMRTYSLKVYTEYLDSTDGQFVTTSFGPFTGGQCLIGGMTEMERAAITDPTHRDVSILEHTGIRFGDASTKPVSSPERVGKYSITSWTDINAGHTKSIFYPYNAEQQPDDSILQLNGWNGHAPIVLRDEVPYTDFLFINRRGALECCSAQMLESMDISVETTQYAKVERPTFAPSRSIMAQATGGRRAWSMSSGYQTREWAEWWVLEFLMARQWWMWYKEQFVPVIVEPAKKQTDIYNRSKQQMPHVDFTVTLALEG